MKTTIKQSGPVTIESKPFKFKGFLKDFKEGQLCFVVARRHRGKGPVKLILHKAIAIEKDSFGYGAFGYWIVSPGTLMGMSKSKNKAEAARRNGRMGGRPQK